MSSGLKTAIKKAITDNSTKFRATKVWKVEVSENLAGECTMWIEVSVEKRRKARRGAPRIFKLAKNLKP